MFTKFAKILNYISSYIPLYILLIWISFNSNEHQIQPSVFVIALLATLVIIGIVWITALFKWKNNTRIGGKVEEQDITKESAVYLATYILPFVSVFDGVGFVFGAIIFFVLGRFAISSGNYFSNPIFYVKGYKLYKFGTKRVFSQKTEEELRRYLTENPHGLSVREVVKNTYIALPQ